MFIKLLDKDLANMIAAGEVVERPASAVKELIENSIDAGAAMITVEIKNGGLKLIKVTDNGCGIHPDDVENAFLRHATSKISKPQDLDAIYTLGFRGEALASIASVARVELYTRPPEFETGMTCIADNGNIENAVETPGFAGTCIKVTDLFYNTPARMKFLKKDSTEAGYVEEVIRKTAIAHPEVSFRFISDGKEKLFTSGDGELAVAVHMLFGKETAAQLLPVEHGDGAITVTGLVSNPVYTRKTRAMQYFYVNNRPVVSRMMTTALEEACKGLIPIGFHPIGFLKLNVPAEAVDVNVHPSKLEVKFSDEKKIYSCIYWAVKNALNAPVIPKITEAEIPAKKEPYGKPFETGGTKTENITVAEGKPPVTVVRPPEAVAVRTPIIPVSKTPRLAEDIPAPVQKIQEKYEKPVKTSNTEEEIREKKTEYIQLGVELDKEIGYNIIGQLFDTFILVQKGDMLMMVDQHAAHEHITYGKLLRQWEESNISTQLLLTPVVVSLTPEEKGIFSENKDFFAEIGFESEDFGGNDIAVRGVPEVMEISRIGFAVCEIIAALKNGRLDAGRSRREHALHTVACRASIKAGKKLKFTEMDDLVKQLFEIEKTVTCPHGRPAWIVMDRQFIEKQFKRIK